ncbi:MAG: DUF4337 domain-containing protein [Candidatus Omnitrophica bacterium]|nr:DUF4337 domain-containing protein [Candidatus Omnitrophota bacterium]
MDVEIPEVEDKDSWGKVIAVQVSLFAVLLSIFTISAHRAHTTTILLGNESTNAWSHYQAKRIRAYQLEMNASLVKLLAPDKPEAAKVLAEYGAQKDKYDKDLEDLKDQANRKIEEGEVSHHQARYFDLSEGMLEIAMILSSLYFITRKKSISILGLLGGILGTIVGILGFMVR